MSDVRCPRCGGPAVQEQIPVPEEGDPYPWPTIPGRLVCVTACDSGDAEPPVAWSDTKPWGGPARREAEAIVRALAASAAPTDEGLWCLFCDPDRETVSLGSLDDPGGHVESCPWRRAREWTETYQ